MSRHDIPDASLDAALRSLDPVDPSGAGLSAAQRARAAATLDRIVASDPSTPLSPHPETGTASRRTRRRVLIAGAVAAVVTAGAVTAPALVGRDQAFASWSPVPVELTGAERAAAVEACAVLQTDEGELATAPGAAPRGLLVESRGGWTYVVLRVAGASMPELQASCLVPDDVLADPRPDEGGWFGSLGSSDEAGAPVRSPRVAREYTSGAGSVDDAAFAYVEGTVGADVESIEVTTPSGQVVQASVEDGWWAAWWPAGDGSADDPDITGVPTYDVTLRDGSPGEVRGPG